MCLILAVWKLTIWVISLFRPPQVCNSSLRNVDILQGPYATFLLLYVFLVCKPALCSGLIVRNSIIVGVRWSYLVDGALAICI